MGWSLGAFKLATKYVSSPWPFLVAAFETYGLYEARLGRLEERFWQSWALLLVPHAKLSLS